MRSKVRPREEVKRKIEQLCQYPGSPFYQKSIEILSWALDKTDGEIRERFIYFARGLGKLPLGADGHNIQFPHWRYEGLALLWLLGNEVGSLSNIVPKPN